MKPIQEIEIATVISGYTLLEKVHEAKPHIIYRATRKEDGQEVIIKTFADKYPKKEDLAGIQREYRITHQLDTDGVIRLYDLVPHSNGNLAIVMERFGVSLIEYLSGFENRILPLDLFFPLAIRLVQVCGHVHDKRIVHKNLEPTNILIDPATGDIRLIDFGSASELSREHLETVSLSKWIEGSLPYISPEQTGRINRDVDYRSDFYSLGVTFYQMITGQLPFSANDPLEWVHCTISRQPPPPDRLNLKIPAILSGIILKLLSKNAENRYQSSYGLAVDLEKCRDYWKKGSVDDAFQLAQSDISRQFQIPQKLYGRKREVKKLESYFENTSHGAVEFCLVSGYSGVGKTVLVRELGRSIVKNKGYLIHGKFEQYRQNAAYVALGNAFRDLIRQLLGEPKKRLENWDEKITQALGSNAQLMVDVIPELTFIIGKQPPVQDLSPAETQNRFLILFINFVKVFATEAHPLVIFLDDLQWSDLPTLNLIHRLVTTHELSHLFLIGAYRDNEVDATHPLSLTLREIQSKRLVENLSLQPLTPEATDQLTMDTLKCEPERSRALSAIFYEKTGGNPFFTIELLKNLKDRGVIFFNTTKSGWDWDIHAVRSVNYSDNVIDILVASQGRLHPATQHVLQLAACIGATFDLRTLSIIRDSTMENTGAELHDALKANMVVPLNDSYKYVSPEVSGQSGIDIGLSVDLNPAYTFQHDRVQQAAYSQIPVVKRQALHLSIGQLMLSHTPPGVVDEKLMDIVGHFNEGRALVTDLKDRRELASLNLAAGIKAKQSSAYESALGYLRIGAEMLGDTAWQIDYRLAWQLHNELQHSFYLTGDWKNADALTDTLLEHSHTAVEKGLVLSARTRQYATTQRMQDSIHAAYDGLAILGFPFIQNPTSDDVATEVTLIHENLHGRSISSLIDLPEITDEKAKIASQLIMEIFPAAFLSGSGEMFPYLVLKSVNISLRYGNSPESAFAYVAYGMLLCGLFDDTAQGYAYGKLGVDMVEKLEDISLKARIIYVYAMFVHHWSNHWSSMTPWFRKGIEAGHQSGDLLYLAYSAQDCIIWDPKLDLETASQEHRRLLDIVKECDYQDSYDSGTLFLQMQLNFQGLTSSKYSMTDDVFDEAQCMEGMYQRHFMTGISNYHIYKAEIHLLYNDAAGALGHVLEQEKRMASVMALPQVVRFHIVSFLVRSMLLPTLALEEQEDYFGKMQDSLRTMTVWARNCQENFEHLRLLMEAELAHFNGNVQEALSLYEQSIVMTRRQGFLRDEAMANEMTARLMLRLGLPKAAEGYLQEAHYLYYRWGAHRKVTEMEKEYHLSQNAGVIKQNKPLGSVQSKPGSLDSDTIHGDMLDINSVLKASQTISGELVLEKLLKATLQVLIENAGAQKGFLVEHREGHIIIQAQSRTDGDPAHQHLHLKDAQGEVVLPITLINTAIRTSEPVVINNASELNPFSSDPYIRKNKPLSVMCVPLPLHGQWPSAVYLENNLTLSAFTGERVKIIKLLASQASISMENARIYEMQERLLKAQQRFVPIQFLKHLGHNDITKVELGESVSMEMSVLFSDIRNFTPLVERLSPKEVIELLNRLYSKMGTPITDAGGFIDSYAGDGIMALFAVPARQSIDAGIQMSRALEEFNRTSKDKGLPPIKLGVGINTGPLVLGTMGANERMQCSVLGDTVNLASRIEQLTRTYEAQCLISEHTYASLEHKEAYSIRMVDRVAVKGKGVAVRLYEILDAETDDRRAAKEATRDILQQAMDAYFSLHFADACRSFTDAMHRDPSDPVFSLFAARSKRYIDQPPADDWQGFEQLQQK